jgi:hypothetical protein
MKRKTATVEIIKSEVVRERPARHQDMGALLDQLVRQRVAEALSNRDDSILQPWFQSKTVANEIRKLQTVTEQRCKALYFEKYGCIHCKTKKHSHNSGGLCNRCHASITSRMRACERELSDAYKAGKGSRITNSEDFCEIRDVGKLAEDCLRPAKRPLRSLPSKSED